MPVSCEILAPLVAEMLPMRCTVRMALLCTCRGPTVLQIRVFLDHFCRLELADSHMRGLALKSILHRVKRQKCRQFLVAGVRRICNIVKAAIIDADSCRAVLFRTTTIENAPNDVDFLTIPAASIALIFC